MIVVMVDVIVTMVVVMSVIMMVAMIVTVVVMAMVVVMMGVVVIVAMMMAMTMMMPMGVRGLIGAAFGLERPLDLADLAAEALQHIGDDMVAPDPQPGRADLGFEMSVAKVPGEPDQMTGIAAADLVQRLGLCHDFDQAAVIEHKGIAMGEGGAFGEIDQKSLAAHCADCAAPPPPVLEIEDDAVGQGTAGQRRSGDEGVGMMHGHNPGMQAARSAELVGHYVSGQALSSKPVSSARANGRRIQAKGPLKTKKAPSAMKPKPAT